MTALALVSGMGLVLACQPSPPLTAQNREVVRQACEIDCRDAGVESLWIGEGVSVCTCKDGKEFRRYYRRVPR